MSRKQIEFIDLKAQYAALRDAIDARIQRVLDHGQYIMGPEVSELEAALAAHTGAKHCITVASGTEALLIALMALGPEAGRRGHHDAVHLRRHRRDDRAARRRAGVRRHRARHLQHRRLADRGRDHAAHPGHHAGEPVRPVRRHGRDQRDRRAPRPAGDRGRGAELRRHATRAGRSGNLSTFGCTSFFPSKPLGCYGDGGAIFTSDDALAQAAREIRVHGQSARYTHTRVGVGGRMDTLQCAIVLAKLERFDWELQRRREIGARYHARLAGAEPDDARPCAPIATASGASTRCASTDRAAGAGGADRRPACPTAVHYPKPLHRQPAYAQLRRRRRAARTAIAAAERGAEPADERRPVATPTWTASSPRWPRAVGLRAQ